MDYSPSDLKLIPLKDVPAGSIAELVGRSQDIPLVLRLADSAGHGDKARIVLLGGSYSFSVAEWGVADALARVVCRSDELRIRLDHSDPQASYNQPGMLTLYNGGAFISAEAQQSHQRFQIALQTWQDVERADLRGELVSYPQWELGGLDHRGEFCSIFQRKKIP